MVGVEDLARADRVEALLGALAPRHREQPVEVGADHRRLSALVAHSLQAADLALGLLTNLVGHIRLGNPGAVVVRDRAVVLAQLLPDRLHLAAQDVLALLALSTLLDVLSNAAADLQLCQALALEADGKLEPLEHVHCLEQLDPLLEGDLRGVACGIGERADLTDRAHEGRDAAVVAAELENLFDDCAVLALELAGLDARRLDVRMLLHLDAKATLRVRLGRAGHATVQADEPDGRTAARQPHRVGHLCDGADPRVLALVARHEQHALFVAHVGGDRDVHVREDDGVVQRDK